jgi:hypothetical protein
MESKIQALRVENLETRLSLHRFVCTSLDLELEFAQTVEASDLLAHRRIQAMNGCDVLELALELLKREAA